VFSRYDYFSAVRYGGLLTRGSMRDFDTQKEATDWLVNNWCKPKDAK